LTHELGHALVHRWISQEKKLLRIPHLDIELSTDERTKVENSFDQYQTLLCAEANYFALCTYWPEPLIKECLQGCMNNPVQAQRRLLELHPIDLDQFDISILRMSSIFAAEQRIIGHIIYSNLIERYRSSFDS